MCTYYQECDPVEFAQDYADLAECKAEMRADLVDAREEYGAACYSAGTAYLSCISSLSCTEDPEVACATQAIRADQECQEDVSSPCPNYVSGTDDDYCCQTHDPCEWANDQYCDCESTCTWDTADCALPN